MWVFFTESLFKERLLKVNVKLECTLLPCVFYSHEAEYS